MKYDIVTVETEEQWQMLKVLLVDLFEYENRLRPNRKDFSQDVTGPFSYIVKNVADHQGIAVLALDQDKPVGFGTGWVIAGDGLDQGDNRRGYFSDAFVLEAYRGNGIYRKIIEARKNHFASLGISTLTVDTLGSNTEMQKVLQKCGFTPHKIFYEMKV